MSDKDFVIEKGILKEYKGSGSKVIIPEGVKRIGGGAFWDCEHVTSITIPDSLKSIDETAFWGCGEINFIISKEKANKSEKFVIKDGVLKEYKGIGGDVIIPDGVTSIGEEAFASCPLLKSVAIPDSVKSIGKNAFKYHNDIEITISENADSRLESFVIKNGVLKQYIGLGGDVEIPDGVKKIGKESFSFCKTLRSVTIPDGVECIGEDAFCGCSSLENVILPNRMTSIERGAFQDCLRLRSFSIPDGISIIQSSLFHNCTNLARISIPDSVIDIEFCAFGGCEKLTNLILPESVENIELEAFEDCSGLTDVTIPNSVKKIGFGAFSGCKKLKNFALGGTDTTFGENVFGSEWPKGLMHQALDFVPFLSTSQLKYYFLNNKSWNHLSIGQQAKLFLIKHDKSLNSSYQKCIGLDKVDLLATEIIDQLKENDSSKYYNGAFAFITLFKSVVSNDLLSELYDLLKNAGKKGEKALSAFEADNLLMQKLHGNNEDGDIDRQPEEEIVINNLKEENQSVDLLEARLKELYCLSFSNLPEVKRSDGKSVASFVLAWLLTVHEKAFENESIWSRRSSPMYKKPGLCEDAKTVLLNLDFSSFQEALKALADEYLVKYQKTKKKFLAFPICRYANEELMDELTKRAPGWKTSVSGTDAPPLRQFIDAVVYSETRAAMLFADKYHELGYYAKLRGVTEQELRDNDLSDIGLNEQGYKNYDLGNQIVTVQMKNDLSFEVVLTDNRTSKSLPKKGSDEQKYKDASADFNKLKKDVKRILKNRKEYLFDAFISGENKAGDDWKTTYLKNPVLKSIGSLIVWKQGNNTFILTDAGPITSDENKYEISNKPIAVAHPMEMKENDLTAWRKYFTDHGLKQPFSQIWEPVIDPKQIQSDRYKGIMIPYYCFRGREKHGIHVEDHNYHNEIYISLDECDAEVERIDWKRHEIDNNDNFEISSIEFDKYTRKLNHIIGYLDKITISGRVIKDDITVHQYLDEFTLEQITEFINLAAEHKCQNVLAMLMEYKNNHYSDYNPMDEFTLEL